MDGDDQQSEPPPPEADTESIAPPGDSDEIRLKKYEQLLEYSRRTFDFHVKRWDDNEAKVGRFITLLLAMLGAGAFSVWRVVDRADFQGGDWPHSFFVAFYVLFAACGLASFGFCVWAYYYRRMDAPNPDAGVVVPYFDGSKYVDVLVGLSRTYLNAAARAEKCASYVQRASHRGYLSLVVSVGFGLLSAASYAIMEKKAYAVPTAQPRAVTTSTSVTNPTPVTTTTTVTTSLH